MISLSYGKLIQFLFHSFIYFILGYTLHYLFINLFMWLKKNNLFMNWQLYQSHQIHRPFVTYPNGCHHYFPRVTDSFTYYLLLSLQQIQPSSIVHVTIAKDEIVIDKFVLVLLLSLSLSFQWISLFDRSSPHVYNLGLIFNFFYWWVIYKYFYKYLIHSVTYLFFFFFFLYISKEGSVTYLNPRPRWIFLSI